MEDEDWDLLVEVVKRMERCFTSYVNTEDIRKLNLARDLIGFDTIAPSNRRSWSFSDRAKIFNGVAFGYNVFLASHRDADYTLSVTSVHIEGHTNCSDDPVVAYFCFPRLGAAVALRPGDVLVFNALEPHANSSCCRESDKLLCLSI